jgi:tetratricopeptide (TPR) repeat protein
MLAASILIAMSALAADAPPEIDPCEPAVDRPARDPALAALYREVGEKEHARGNEEAAAIALRLAADLDPDEPRAALLLAEICKTRSSTEAEDAIREAIDLLDDGRCAEALARLGPTTPNDPPEAALVRGICHLAEGDASARSELLEAAKSPALEQTAHLLLAAIALREGESDTARGLLSGVTGSSPGTARAASDLERLIAGGTGALVAVAATVDGIVDSNPGLASDQERAAPPEGRIVGSDAAVRTAAAAHYAPLRRVGPYVDGAVSYLKNATYDLFDLGAVDAAAGLRIGRDDLGVAIEYAFDYEIQGGHAYLAAHNAGARAHFATGPFRMTAAYLARIESFLTDAARTGSGLLQVASIDAGFDLSTWAWIRAGYHGAYDKTDAAALAYLEHGPRAQLSLRPISVLRIALDSVASFRRYDARQDTEIDALATAELYLGSSFSLAASGIVRRNESTDVDQRYTRLIALAGVRWARGLF